MIQLNEVWLRDFIVSNVWTFLITDRYSRFAFFVHFFLRVPFLVSRFIIKSRRSRQQSLRRICFLLFALCDQFPFFIRAVAHWCAPLEKNLPSKQKLLARPKVHLRAAPRQCPRSPEQSAQPQSWRTNRPRTRPRPRFRIRATPSVLPRFFFKGSKVNLEFRFDDKIHRTNRVFEP